MYRFPAVPCGDLYAPITSGRSSDFRIILVTTPSQQFCSALRHPHLASGILWRLSPITAAGPSSIFTRFPILLYWRAPFVIYVGQPPVNTRSTCNRFIRKLLLKSQVEYIFRCRRISTGNGTGHLGWRPSLARTIRRWSYRQKRSGKISGRYKKPHPVNRVRFKRFTTAI